jgi:hypothetical protein
MVVVPDNDDHLHPVNNSISGAVSGNVVQAGKIIGDVHVHHHPAADRESNPVPSRWSPDPHFTGRRQLLADLRRHLRIGEPGDVAPVVLHGLTGNGKTSVATQLGAELPDAIRPIFLNGETRTSLLEDIGRLTGSSAGTAWDSTGISAAAGPVTPELPVSPDTLLVIDGVTSSDTLRGIVPRASACRILITSTVRHLDQGYVHVELDDWTPEESVSYLRHALPGSDDADRARLAEALHHHPLALTQAANHCRLLNRSVGVFLQRLADERVRVLALGEASGHHRTTLRSIEMNIDLATRKEPLSSSVLRLLAYLGSEPLPRSLFEQEFPLVFVQGYGRARPKWLRRLNFLLGEHARSTLSVAKRLHEPLSRDRAISSLLELSLVRITGDGYQIHPLVALVARSVVSNPLPWLQIGFGVIADRMGDVHADDADVCLSHLTQLTTMAIAHGHRGTAVLVACVHLARRLAFLGEQSESTNAADFAEHVISTFQGQTPPKEVASLVLDAQLALAQIEFRGGDALSAIARCEGVLAASTQAGHRSLYLSSLRTIGEMAAVVGRRDLARRVLERLETDEERFELDLHSRLSIMNTRTAIHIALNDMNQARTSSAWACARLAAGHEVHTGVRQSVLQMAALVAKTTSDSSAWLRYELALLDIRRAEQSNGRRQDRWFVESLHSAADAAIDANQLGLADDLVTEAMETVTNVFGQGSENYANVLAVRGRLYFHQRRLTPALRDLTYCADYFRAQPAPRNGLITAVLVHLAYVLLFTGHKNRAIAAATEAYEIDRDLYGEDHPETQKDLEALNMVRSLPALRHRGQ